MTDEFNVPADWHENFFTGPANAFWERMVSAEATAAELAFIERHLRLAPPAHILDMPCGAGRHALGLAERGYRVTGVDLSADAISRAAAAAAARNLRAAFVRGDMRRFEADAPFDGILCFGNSISYFEPEQTLAFFRALRKNLKPAARLIVDTYSCAESIFPLKGERRLDFENGSYQARLSYDPMTARLSTAATLRLGKESHALLYAHYVLTAGELVRLLRAAGLTTLALYADTDDAPFVAGAPRLLLVAARE